MDSTSFTIVQPMPSQARFYFPEEIGTHEGFRWGKSDQYQLYFIIDVPGKVMPYSLSSKFTKLTELTRTIDRWIIENGSIEALQDIPAPVVKRSHHNKSKQKEELIEQDNND
jgi:hypothetical protein